MKKRMTYEQMTYEKWRRSMQNWVWVNQQKEYSASSYFDFLGNSKHCRLDGTKQNSGRIPRFC